MTDDEVRSRLDAIKRYNEYFERELDAEGKPLTQHIVGPRQLWNILKNEWGVDPTKFGIAEPPKADWKGNNPKPAPELTEFGHGF